MTNLSEVMFHEAPLDPAGRGLVGLRSRAEGTLKLSADYERGLVVVERPGYDAVEVPFSNVRAMRRAPAAAKK